MFVCRKQGKLQKRGKINLIGRLQLTSEKTREEDNEGIVQLRILRTQVWREGEREMGEMEEGMEGRRKWRRGGKGEYGGRVKGEEGKV